MFKLMDKKIRSVDSLLLAEANFEDKKGEISNTTLHDEINPQIRMNWSILRGRSISA